MNMLRNFKKIIIIIIIKLDKCSSLYNLCKIKKIMISFLGCYNFSEYHVVTGLCAKYGKLNISYYCNY